MKHITTGACALARSARNSHVCIIPHGNELADLLKPEFWAHVATRFRKKDRIEAWSEDESWFAELVVVNADRLSVRAVLVSKTDLDKPVASEKPPEGIPSGYIVNYGGPVHKYRVLRAADSEVLAHGMSKREAEDWAVKDAAAKFQRAESVAA